MIDSVSTPGAPRTEHLRQDAFPRSDVRGKSQHFDHDLVVDRRPFGAGIADQDRVAERPAVDLDIALSVALEIGSHERDPTPARAPPRAARIAVPTCGGRFVSRTSTSSPRVRVAHVGRVDIDLAGRSRPASDSCGRKKPAPVLTV